MFDRQIRAQRPQRHITGQAAIEAANAANREIGALKALETVRRVYTSQHLGVTSNWVIGDFRSVEEKGCELRACLRRHRGGLMGVCDRDFNPPTAPG